MGSVMQCVRPRRRKGRCIVKNTVGLLGVMACVAMTLCGNTHGAITYTKTDRGALVSVAIAGETYNVNNWTSTPGTLVQWSHLNRVLGAQGPSVIASAVFDTWTHNAFLELHSSNVAYYNSFGPTTCTAWARTDAHIDFSLDTEERFILQRHGPGLASVNLFYLLEFTGPAGVVLADGAWETFSGVLTPGDYHLRIVSDMRLPTGTGEANAAQSYHFVVGVPTPGTSALLAAALGLMTVKRRR